MGDHARSSAVAGDHLTLEVECAYPGGLRVLCLSVAEVVAGHIVTQRIVQAWDS